MDKIDMNRFCDKSELACERDDFAKPFVLEKHEYAGSSKLMVRIPTKKRMKGSHPIADLILSLPWEDRKEEIDLELPDNVDVKERDCPECKGKKTVCPECDGSGEVELWNSYNDYTCECGTCEGEGVVGCSRCEGSGKVDNSQEFLCVGDGKYLSRSIISLLKVLPNLRIYRTSYSNILAFTFGKDYEGVLMTASSC